MKEANKPGLCPIMREPCVKDKVTGDYSGCEWASSYVDGFCTLYSIADSLGNIMISLEEINKAGIDTYEQN